MNSLPYPYDEVTRHSNQKLMVHFMDIKNRYDTNLDPKENIMRP